MPGGGGRPGGGGGSGGESGGGGSITPQPMPPPPPPTRPKVDCMCVQRPPTLANRKVLTVNGKVIDWLLTEEC